MGRKMYVIRDMNGRFWTGGRWGGVFFAKLFTSVGAVVACMRQLKYCGYRCYYERF